MDTLIEWSRVLSLVVLLVQALLCWVLWSLRKQFVGRDHCNKQCLEMDRRQTVLETAQRAMPDATDVDAIKDRLGSIEGDMKGVLATMKGLSEALGKLERPLNLLIEHHLRENK
jgi:hypothetical protein